MQAVIERDLTETIRDVVSLAKPRITLFVLITTAGGLGLAGGVDLRTAILTEAEGAKLGLTESASGVPEDDETVTKERLDALEAR